MNTIIVHPLNSTLSERPTWSVIIPTYNCAKYLKQTLESVLMQDPGEKKMEIWVVDDCSADDPEQIIKEIGTNRVKFYQQKQNVGQLNNFSTCLNLSKGHIIHLLHGDDFIHDGFYKTLEPYIINDNTIGAAFTGHNIVDQNGNLIVQADQLISKAGTIADFLSVITRKQVIQTPSIVVKRAVYEKLGAFNTDLSSLEDWEMWIRIACNYKFYYDPKTLASYRIHNNSNTADSLKSSRFVGDILKCIKVYSSYLPINEKEKRDTIKSAKLHYINFAIQRSRENLSVLVLLRALKLSYDIKSFLLVFKQMPKVLIKSVLK